MKKINTFRGEKGEYKPLKPIIGISAPTSLRLRWLIFTFLTPKNIFFPAPNNILKILELNSVCGF
jgi:hypothetical protein